jgi:hypothetical protein
MGLITFSVGIVIPWFLKRTSSIYLMGVAEHVILHCMFFFTPMTHKACEPRTVLSRLLYYR